MDKIQQAKCMIMNLEINKDFCYTQHLGAVR